MTFIIEPNKFLSNRYSETWATLAITRRGQSTGWFFFTLVAVLGQTEDFFSGFRQRPWWVFCRRNTWFRSRRWSTTARSSWTSTTSWAKWRSFRREPFLHLKIRPHLIQSSIWSRPTRISSEADLNRHIPFGIAKPIYCKMFSKLHVLYIHMISKDQ